jgi:hypothetical protein
MLEYTSIFSSRYMQKEILDKRLVTVLESSWGVWKKQIGNEVEGHFTLSMLKIFLFFKPCDYISIQTLTENHVYLM